MANSTLQVLIDIKSKLEGLEQAVAQMRQLKAETEAIAKAGAGGFAELFKIGESIDLTRRLNDLVSEIPRKLLEWTLEGVRFNAEIEKSRIGIAAMLRQFDPGQFQTFGKALEASGPVLDLLRAKSIELGVSFPALAEQYQSTVGAMFQGGIRDIQKQIELTALLRQATQALPFAQNVIQRDLVDILQAAPRAAVTDVGRTLGIDQQGLDRAKEAGTIAAYLTSKLQGFQQATEFTKQTLSATEERAKTLQQQLAGTFTTELVVAYKNALDDANAALSNPKTAEDVAALGSFVGAVAHGWLAVTEGIVGATEKLDAYLEQLAIVKAIQDNPLANAIDQARAAQFFDVESKKLILLRDQIAAANTQKEQDAARVKLNAEVASLFERANSTEGEMHRTAIVLIQDSALLVNNFDRIAGSAEKTRGAMAQTAEQIERVTKANEAIAKAQQETAILGAKNSGDDQLAFNLEKQKATVALYKDLLKVPGVTNDAALAAANARGAELTRQFQDQNTLKKEGLQLSEDEKQVDILLASGRESEANALDRENQIRKEIRSLIAAGESDEDKARQIATQHVDAEIQIKNAKEGTKIAQQALLALERETTGTLQAVRQQQQLINQNPFLTIDEKNARLLVSMREEIGTLNEEVKNGQALLDGGTLDKATYEQLALKVQDARFQVELLAQKTQTLSFSGGLKENLTQWVSSFGTAAQQVGKAITGSINTALDATANALTDVIFRTGNWRQTVLQAEKGIVSSLIKIGLEMLVQATLGKVIRNWVTQDQVQSNAKVLASATPTAVAQSGATGGSNWIIGAIAAAAAIAAIISLMSGGFEKGGYTGPGGSKAIAGVVHGQEFVHPKSVVDHYGLPFMTAIYERRLSADQVQAMLGNYRYTSVTPRLGSFEVGGAVAAIDGSENNGRPNIRESPAPVIKGFKAVVINDMDQLKKEIFKSDEAVVWLIDAIKGNAHLVRGSLA
jgi:hypothetical protein